MISLYNVMTKDVLINLRIKEDVRDDFKIAADIKGATMSSLLHQYIYKIIREEKERDPKAFEARPTTAFMDDMGELGENDRSKIKKEKAG